LSESAKGKLATDGYDPAYGARPLKRVIQRELQDPLALALLEGRFCPGDTVYVDVAGDELVFSEMEEPLAVVA
jgi:ATP-dependent Clp protease ATP-binding subunit ClpB